MCRGATDGAVYGVLIAVCAFSHGAQPTTSPRQVARSVGVNNNENCRRKCQEHSMNELLFLTSRSAPQMYRMFETLYEIYKRLHKALQNA